MEHQKYREWMQLWFYDELNADERMLLEHHVRECAECAAEQEQLRSFHRTLSEFAPARSVDDILRTSRAELRLAIRQISSRRSLWEQALEYIADLLSPRLQVALGGVAFLLVGMFLGSRLVKDEPKVEGLFTAAATESAASMAHGDARISNFKFVERNEAEGEVAFTFEAATPVHIKGRINDPRIQQILARAMLSDDNPGVRLRAASTIAEKGNIPGSNLEVKHALIATMKFDRNPGVRQEALKALQRYLPDPEATQAFLFLLTNEKNTGIKIAAINALDIAKYEGQPSREEVLALLRETVQSDNNNYIRLRARAALKEVQQ